ncbi:MAG: type II secretion system protein [Planctomycetota bacterium]|nr:type II secretion system protein [Planctomycetota bacterium]
MMTPPPIPTRRRPRRRGFTLIELLVAVGILIIMLLAFGQIIAQSQDLVDGCQQIMQMNTTASVAAQILQRDLLSLSKDGLLTTGSGRLTFTSVAPHVSVQDPTITANGALVDYGRKAFGADGILWRQALLLVGTNGGGAATDILPSNLGPSLTVPEPILPADASAPMGANASQYWAYFSGGCTKFDSASWTGGSSGTWNNNTATFNSPNPANWPTAVKVIFGLKQGAQKQDYELIIDLP